MSSKPYITKKLISQKIVQLQEAAKRLSRKKNAHSKQLLRNTLKKINQLTALKQKTMSSSKLTHAAFSIMFNPPRKTTRKRRRS